MRQLWKAKCHTIVTVCKYFGLNVNLNKSMVRKICHKTGDIEMIKGNKEKGVLNN
jgi:hypothetical protein